MKNQWIESTAAAAAATAAVITVVAARNDDGDDIAAVAGGNAEILLPFVSHRYCYRKVTVVFLAAEALLLLLLQLMIICHTNSRSYTSRTITSFLFIVLSYKW